MLKIRKFVTCLVLTERQSNHFRSLLYDFAYQYERRDQRVRQYHLSKCFART